ncbi:MAG: protein kinase [bacterium]
MTASPPTNPADADLLARLARALAPSYEMEVEIGRGGMAIVYRARDTRLKRGVAVKLLPPDLAFRADTRTRFLREAETAARLSHPNIVPIYTVDERDGLVYFVMALVQGGSVGDRLRQSGALPIADARRILREVADALGYAHRNGVVHRDIKPDNVLLDADTGRAMVTDFGIARAASEEGGASRLTATGAAIGTPAYMSPEQCAGDREIDGRSDLYSLGTVAYQMLAGDPPFSGGNTPSIMMKQVTERPAPIGQRRSDLPGDLERIVMRLLEKDPANRFATGEDLVAALDGVPFTSVEARTESGPTKLTMEVGPIAARGASTRIPPASANPTSALGESFTARYAGMSRRDIARQVRREAREMRRGSKNEPKPLSDRVRGFRKEFVSFLGTSAMLTGINAMTGGGFWWCVFPIMGLGLGVVTRMGSLWADGVPLGRMLAGPLPPDTPRLDHGTPLPALVSASPGSTSATPGVSDEVLAGPHGAILRQAITDRRTVHDLTGRLTDAERKMLPDVKGTADALFDRIEHLSSALHRLDGQVDADRAPALIERIAQIEAQPPGSSDRERRLTLLKRQRDMLADLVQSRARLLEQYESAGLLLQNLALDLLKVRSSGLDSALGGITSATQEARALSREIGYVLDAADELRGLDGEGKPDGRPS